MAEQNCITGGYNASFPIGGNKIFGNTFYVAIEGNDTSFAPFKTCCAPFEVQLAGPCLMWCQTNGDYNGMTDCWKRENFHPEAFFGSSSNSGSGWSSGFQGNNKNAIIGVSVGSVVAAALLGGAGFWFWRRRRAAAAAALVADKDLEGYEGVKEMEQTEARYDNVKYDVMVDRAERADEKSLANEVSSVDKK